jgi:hypothetical protein
VEGEELTTKLTKSTKKKKIREDKKKFYYLEPVLVYQKLWIEILKKFMDKITRLDFNCQDLINFP